MHRRAFIGSLAALPFATHPVFAATARHERIDLTFEVVPVQTDRGLAIQMGRNNFDEARAALERFKRTAVSGDTFTFTLNGEEHGTIVAE